MVYDSAMGIESANGSGDKNRKVRTFGEMGSMLGVEPRNKKPPRGRRHKTERQESRKQNEGREKAAKQFRHEIDAEMDAILRHAQLADCQGELSTELRAENGKYEIEIEITNAVLPDDFDLRSAADRIKNRIESDPRNPNGVTCLVRIARARDRNREALEKAEKPPQYSLAAQQDMIKRESERRAELLEKLGEQLQRDGFLPREGGREIFYPENKDASGGLDVDPVCDNEDVSPATRTTIRRLSLIEPGLFSTRPTHVLLQLPDGTIKLESRAIGARIRGETATAGAVQEALENAKAELFPKLRPRLKEFALGVGTTKINEDDRVQLLSRIVAAEMTEALDDILRLEKSSGKKGKALARTNMIGGTTLFNRLQRLGLIDETATQINQAKIQNHLLDYLNNGNNAKENFVIALHNISSRFKKGSRERVFPRNLELLQARILELGLSAPTKPSDGDTLQPDELAPQVEEWKLALGIHPDADGEGVPRVLRRSLEPLPHPIVTEAYAAFLRDIDAIKRTEPREIQGEQTENPADLIVQYRKTIIELESELAKLGSRTPAQARARIKELEYEKGVLETRLSKATSDLSAAQDEIIVILTSLDDEVQQKVDAENRAIDRNVKISELTTELQRVEAKHVILETLIEKLREVAHDPDAVKMLTTEAADALRIISE